MKKKLSHRQPLKSCQNLLILSHLSESFDVPAWRLQVNHKLLMVLVIVFLGTYVFFFNLNENLYLKLNELFKRND